MGEAGFVADFGGYFTPDYVGHPGGQHPQTLDDLILLERGFAASFSNTAYDVEDLCQLPGPIPGPLWMGEGPCSPRAADGRRGNPA